MYKSVNTEVASHVQYEIDMLEFGLSYLAKSARPTDEKMEFQEKLDRAILESFLLHYRNLRDFLGKTDHGSHPDDILAIHFMNCKFDDWKNKCPIKLAKDDPEKYRLDKMLAHISTSRLNYKDRKQSSWDTQKLYNEIITGLKIFHELLPDERKSWFSIPDQVADNPQRRTICDSTSSYDSIAGSSY
jgi:hypothetical protein